MANPTWFNAKEYLANKLDQLKATEPTKSWTAEDLTKAMEKAGYTGDEGAYKHFNDFGMNENVSPNATFNVSEYLAAKVKQLNDIKFEGKEWSEATLMKAITDAGMKSAWEHFDKYGSQEGINPSNLFDTNKYFMEKTILMNETKEGGRADWTVDQVKAAFDAAGLNVVEHYNLFGAAEFKAANKDTKVDFKVSDTNKVNPDGSYNPYSGVETYATLADALAAQEKGTLALQYTISNYDDAGKVTTAQQAGLKDFLAKASPAITDTPTYTLEDTMAGINAATTLVFANSEIDGVKGQYNIIDSLANVAAGDDTLVNGAATATANVTFGAKGVTPAAGGVAEKPADSSTTMLKYSDIEGNDDGSITLAKATDDKAEGNAVIVIDATANDKALGTSSADAFAITTVNDAFDATALTDNGLTYEFLGSSKADHLTLTGAAADKITSINAGAGKDNLYLDLTSAKWEGDFAIDGGAGEDTLHLTGTSNFSSEGKLNSIEAIAVEAAVAKLLLNEETEGFTIDVNVASGANQIVGGQGADKITLSGNVSTTIRFMDNTEPTDGPNEHFHASFYKDDVIKGFTWGASNPDKLMVSEVLGGLDNTTPFNSGHTIADGVTALAAGKQVITLTDLDALTTDNVVVGAAAAGKIGATANTKFFVACDNVADPTNDANMYFVTVGATTDKITVELVGTVNTIATGAWSPTADNFS